MKPCLAGTGYQTLSNILRLKVTKILPLTYRVGCTTRSQPLAFLVICTNGLATQFPCYYEVQLSGGHLCGYIIFIAPCNLFGPVMIYDVLNICCGIYISF